LKDLVMNINQVIKYLIELIICKKIK
jgi:hypothetical protein